MNKKAKYKKPVNISMGFDEMIQRISNVPKSQVENNIKRKKKNEKK